MPNYFRVYSKEKRTVQESLIYLKQLGWKLYISTNNLISATGKKTMSEKWLGFKELVEAKGNTND